MICQTSYYSIDMLIAVIFRYNTSVKAEFNGKNVLNCLLQLLLDHCIAKALHFLFRSYEDC